MALSTARMHKVRGRPPLLAAGISSLSHSHSSSVRSLGYVFSFIFSFYTTHEDFSDRLSDHHEHDIFPTKGRHQGVPTPGHLAAGDPSFAPAGTGAQDARENFWNVWQSAGARPRLTAKVQVTSLT